MGVDTFIFDERSKECFYFDRNLNFFAHAVHPEYDPTYGHVMNQGNFDRDENERFTSSDVAHCCDVNIEYWETGGEREHHRAEWNKSIKRFVTERPHGAFFFRNDHQDPSSHDIRKGRTGGPLYAEIEY